MKTYLVVIVDTVNPFYGTFGPKRSIEAVIFDSIEQASNFINRKPSYDYLDDSMPRLKEDESVLGVYCALSDSIGNIVHRADKFAQRYESEL